MSEKISEDAVLGISYQFFVKFRPTIALPERTPPEKALDAYADMCATEFARFHKLFYSRMLAELESGK